MPLKMSFGSSYAFHFFVGNFFIDCMSKNAFFRRSGEKNIVLIENCL